MSEPHLEPACVSTAEGVDRLARATYGAPLGPIEGVSHVAAVWRPPGASALTVLRINDDTPESPWDAFALNFARARARAILTTGSILRAEPEVRYTLQGPGRLADGLQAWRARAGLSEPPLLAVLTSGRGFRWDHPAIEAAARVRIYTGPEGARLLCRGAPASAEVVSMTAPDPRAVVESLSAEVGGLSVEAGPSVARALYRAPAVVDELMLSILEALEMSAGCRGDELCVDLEQGGDFVASGSFFRPDSLLGGWGFVRYLNGLRGARRKNGKKDVVGE